MPETCSCEELNKKLDQLIEQTKALPAGKGKRAPTKWTNFLKTCLPQKTGPLPGRVKACSVEYKQRKGT